MTTKTKQEALCCQDLSVRCARAEMERDAAKASEKSTLSILLSLGERDHNRDLAFAKLREDHKDLKDRHAALREFNTRTLLVNAALTRPSPPAGYVDIEGVPPEEPWDWSTYLFGALLLSGLGAWIYELVKLIEFAAGRFA